MFKSTAVACSWGGVGHAAALHTVGGGPDCSLRLAGLRSGECPGCEESLPGPDGHLPGESLPSRPDHPAGIHRPSLHIHPAAKGCTTPAACRRTPSLSVVPGPHHLFTQPSPSPCSNPPYASSPSQVLATTGAALSPQGVPQVPGHECWSCGQPGHIRKECPLVEVGQVVRVAPYTLPPVQGGQCSSKDSRGYTSANGGLVI